MTELNKNDNQVASEQQEEGQSQQQPGQPEQINDGAVKKGDSVTTPGDADTASEAAVPIYVEEQEPSVRSGGHMYQVDENGGDAFIAIPDNKGGGGASAVDCDETTEESTKGKKVSADESLTAGAKKIELSGGVLPIVTLFIFGALLGLLSTTLAGVFLYEFASNTVQDTVLTQGSSQIAALRARVAPEYAMMDEFIDSTHATIAAEIADHGPILNYEDAEMRLNTSVMATAPSRIQEPHQLAGMGFIALFPPGANPAEAETIFYTSMYYEPLRDGSRGYGYESTLPDPSGAFNGTGRWGRPMEYNNISGVAVGRIYSDPENYDWTEDEYVEGYVNWEDDSTTYNTKRRSSLEPWRSSYDGFPYWWMETYEYFEIGGSWFAASCFKYVLQLTPVLAEVLGDSTTSQIFVYQPINRAIMGTTYAPETNRSAWCYGSAEDFWEQTSADDTTDYDSTTNACLYLPPENSSYAIIRDLFAATEDRETWGVVDSVVADQAFLAPLDGADYFIVTQQLVNTGNQRLFVLWIRDAESELAQMRKDVIRVVGICCGCILGASILTMIIAIVGIINPLQDLSVDMDALAALETERFFTPEKLNSGSIFREIQQLQTRFVAMAMSLHTFGLYVPRDVVKEVLADPSKMTLTMDRRDLTVLFADIAGFTTLSERFDDDQPFFGKIMGTFFRKATQVIHKNGGTIDKFIGDCVMCFWGAPLAVDEPCTRAVCAGLELLQVGPEVAQVFRSAEIQMSLRVGIHVGACLVGNSGSEERLNYTALGDPVNTASRMEGGNKAYKSAMMISREVLNETGRGDRICYRSVGSMPIRGKISEVEGFEVFGFTDQAMSLPKNALTAMMGMDNQSMGSKKSGGAKSAQSSKRSGSIAKGGSSSGRGGDDDGSHRSSLAAEKEEKELERMRKQRTEMLPASESCLKIQKKFKMTSRLLTACALNNQALYAAEDQEDFAMARDFYSQCVTQLENELKDLNHKHLPLLMARMRNFADHIQTQVVKMKEAEAEGRYTRPVGAEDEDL